MPGARAEEDEDEEEGWGDAKETAEGRAFAPPRGLSRADATVGLPVCAAVLVADPDPPCEAEGKAEDDDGSDDDEAESRAAAALPFWPLPVGERS